MTGIQENSPSLFKKTIFSEFSAIDIFSGAGGLSLGAEQAGLKITLAVEMDQYAAQTFASNHLSTKMINANIENVDPSLYINYQPFIIFGGPPCQGFSTSNTKTRSNKNENNQLFKEFFRFVDILQPEWFLFENVEGITTFENGKTIREIKRLFKKIGYSTNENVLNAADYGVPQNRNRFIMVGNKNGIVFKFPEKNNLKITVGEAISDLPNLDNGSKYHELPYKLHKNEISDYAKILRGNSNYSFQNYVSQNKDYVLERYNHIKQGENWQAIPEELMENYTNKKNCHSGIYRRLEEKSPSVVISNYRKNMLIHPNQNRGLSVREAARLQSFPDNFIFKGTLMSMQQQIGNAVPPLLATHIFNRIIGY
tara:strand:+ start:1273 stop:2376 length:1104 start_codon:yes stop_codon:yes gene_type:complete